MQSTLYSAWHVVILSKCWPLLSETRKTAARFFFFFFFNSMGLSMVRAWKLQQTVEEWYCTETFLEKWKRKKVRNYDVYLLKLTPSVSASPVSPSTSSTPETARPTPPPPPQPPQHKMTRIKTFTRTHFPLTMSK